MYFYDTSYPCTWSHIQRHFESTEDMKVNLVLALLPKQRICIQVSLASAFAY